MVENITKDNFEDKIKEGISVVKAGAEFCNPCRQMKPILEKLSNDHKDVMVGDIDVENEQELGMQLGVRSIPHTFIFKDGVKVDEFIGIEDTTRISKRINSFL